MRSWAEILAEHRRMTDALAASAETLDAIVTAIGARLRGAGGAVFVFGNGGSAADAQHIACELLGRFKINRRALAAIALTTDSSSLTAIGNDLGFEQVFARQLEALVEAGDIVWGLSTSGNSPNVVAAMKLARQRGAVTVGFTGESGGALAELCDHLLRVPARATDRIQEGHALAYHYICERVEAELAADQR